MTENSETITPTEVRIPMPSTNSSQKKKYVVVKGVVYEQSEYEKLQATQAQGQPQTYELKPKQETQEMNETEEDSDQSNIVHFRFFSVNIYVIYIIMFIINILMVQWGGLVTGFLSCFILSLYLS